MSSQSNAVTMTMVHTPSGTIPSSSSSVVSVSSTGSSTSTSSQSKMRVFRGNDNRTAQSSSSSRPVPVTTPITTDVPVVPPRTRDRSESPHGRSSGRRGGLMARIRSRSRSRSRSRRARADSEDASVTSQDSASTGGSGWSDSNHGRMLVTVTSCRSDAYHSQKAPGATTKVPRKAPSALKLFHELAVGVKDAYAAIGATPTRPTDEDSEGHKILYEFMGNLDFLLALVDEVATDTATRGALKEDVTFKSLRDVIKKCNKILENMLVRRERKYTLFFRLVQPEDDLKKIQVWNKRVEDAVGSVTTDSKNNTPGDDSGVSSKSSGGGIFKRRRGRSLMPKSASKIRSRRATPTPSLRNKFNSASSQNSAEDGFSTVTAPMTSQNLAKLQQSLGNEKNGGSNNEVGKPQAKDELVDVIRGLQTEKRLKSASNENNVNAVDGASGNGALVLDTINGESDFKSQWLPKADIPSAVPKLPVEYIHRHRLMKQVVNCLLDRNNQTSSPVNVDDAEEDATDGSGDYITSITSRHADKAGNGKTTLAVATIQTVEIRERFCDGILWLQLGRTPLTEKDVRRLYDELHHQLQTHDNTPSESSSVCGDLEGIKEDIGRMLRNKNILLVLDDVWRMEDVQWFLFRHMEKDVNFRILLTTRTPSLLKSCQEVYVRIFSEHEAVKLLLSSAGRRMYGGKNSPVFHQARIIVKGCGNSPLALRLAGGMLRTANRNWTLKSSTWTALVDQCRSNLEEASHIRSFVHSVGRIVDILFCTLQQDISIRAVMRNCFVTFAMVFHNNDWILSGKGIPQSVILALFSTIHNTDHTSQELLDLLEHLNLLQRARHGGDTTITGDVGSAENPSYLMHESIKYIAEDMATRGTPSFAPEADAYTTFTKEMEQERIFEEKQQEMIPQPNCSLDSLGDSPNNSWLSTAANYIFKKQPMKTSSKPREEYQFHQLLVESLDRWDGKNDDDRMEKYVTAYLPTHLLRANMWSRAGSLLIDDSFLQRRIVALGPVEATQRQMSDLADLRRDAKFQPDEVTSDLMVWTRDAARKIIDEVYASTESSNCTSYQMAICLSTVGEGLLKSKQPRDAMLRLEEAVGIYRGLLGPNHLDVARAIHSVAKALIKCHEPQLALEKLQEAAAIFMADKEHNDAIANSHTMAQLFVECKQWERATVTYEKVISLRRNVHGPNSFSVAKTVNDFAVVLAKHGHMDASLQQYSAARSIFEHLQQQHHQSSKPMNVADRPGTSEDESTGTGKYDFDITLIDLNIASIKSKKGDYEGAIAFYQKGITGLKLLEKVEEEDSTKKSTQKRHLVSAIGRVGSLKMKLGDNAGALEAYLTLLHHVSEESPSTPTSSLIEKAKAHVKCATIYRSTFSKDDNAISHLEQAFRMYTRLHGPNHKDTQAIASSLRQWKLQQLSPDSSVMPSPTTSPMSPTSVEDA